MFHSTALIGLLFIFIYKACKSKRRLLYSIILIIALFARQIVNIVIGQEYVEYVNIVYPLLLWVLMGIINNFYGVQTLVASGYEKEYGKIFQYGIYSTVLFSVLLTYAWGIYGAAIAPADSEVILYIAFRTKIRGVMNGN